MKIAFRAPQNEFADALFQGIQAQFPEDQVLLWAQDQPAPAADLEVLFAWGPVDRALMEAQPKLALVQTVSDGYEAVDVEAASVLGIWVSYAPGKESGNADSVAEYAVMLLIAACRRLRQGLAFAEQRSAPRPLLNRALAGMTVCLVGYGEIGSRVADRLRPFGVRLTAVNRRPERVPTDIPVWRLDQLREALAEADAAVLCVRASEENRHLIDAEVLQAAQRGMVLVNVARGSLIEEQAMVEALRAGQLFAVGLDVVEHDPVRPDDPLLEMTRAFVSPHLAGFTDRTLAGTVGYLGEAVQRFREGRRFGSLLNEPKAPRRPLRA